MMFRGLHRLVFNLFMWVDQLYLLFSVRPSIVVFLVSGIFTVPVRISDLQLCLRHMCRLWHFSIDREAPESEHQCPISWKREDRSTMGFLYPLLVE